jgi:Do/DeqQ family serine protease
MRKLARGLMFVAASVVSGLALAFVIVAWRPELVRRQAPPNPPAPPVVAVAATDPAPAHAPVTYAEAVQRAAPAVVNIYTARLVTERVAPSAFDQLFGDFWPSYRSREERSLGSGVIADADGHIITNNHVIANADEIRVQLADGRSAVASIVGRDPDTDLAVVQIKLKNLPVMPLGHSDRLKVGDVVLAIGDPLGLSQTVTHGIVSATRREQLGLATFENFIQTDAAINFGNSGGALIDTNGELVGINTAIVAKNLGVEGIGFAIPVNMVRGVLSDIIAQGRVVRGWVGIVPEDITNEQAAQLGLLHGGVVLANLYVGSPAVQAGMRPGDLLDEIDGAAVHSAQEASARIASAQPGVMLTIRGLRGRAPFEAKVRVTERPQNR